MTDTETKQYEKDGYCIIRKAIPLEHVLEVRGIIKNIILKPESDKSAERDPMDPMGSDPAAAAARFRKLSGLGVQAPLVWNHIYTSPVLLQYASIFMGKDILMKFNSCFLKPARTGSATPWHQDNGLWRDGETEPFNFWIALDPATKENGCMQFIPGSHQTEIVEHVLLEKSIHGELPPQRVEEQIAQNGVHHIELQPGDMAFWHSNLWHYSPPNTSEQSRIGIAGVYSNPDIASKTQHYKRLYWVQRDGLACRNFPPEPFLVGDGINVKLPAYPNAYSNEPVGANL